MPPARLTMVEARSSPAARPPSLSLRRLAVMHPDPGSADALAQALRAKGAEVAALSLNPDSLHRVEALDPDVVIMEPADFTGSCWEIVRALWQHPRLRFAAVLLATPELMGSERVSGLDVQDLSFAVHRLAEDYERVRRDAQRNEPLSLSLGTLGPARTLRALLESACSLRARFVASSYVVEVDLAEGIVVGAEGRTIPGAPVGSRADLDGDPLLGVHALAFLMAQHEGSVQVRRVDHPAHTNVMAPLDTALHMAREVSGVQRPSGLRWAPVLQPVANTNAATSPPAARLSNRPPAPGQQRPPPPGRTLIGIPAVSVDARLAGEPAPLNPPDGARAGSLSAVLVKPAAPITAMPPAPRISAPDAALERPGARPTRATLAPGATSAVLPAVVAAPPVGAPSPASRPPLTPRVYSEPPAARAASVPQAPLAVSSVPAAPESVPIVAASLSLVPRASHAGAQPSPAAASMFGAPGTLHGMADALEPSVLEALPQLPSPSTSRRETLKKVHFKLAAVALLAVVALWVAVRVVSALAGSPSTPATASATAVPATPLPARASVAEPAALPTKAQVADEAEQEDDRPSRRASELVSQGHVFRRKHMLPTARSRYLDALREYPGYPRALAGLAQVSLESGDPAQALQFARQLVRVRPGQAGYHLLLGDALKAAGQASQARASFETAAKLGSREAKRRLSK